jgi:hypothetical protein
LPRNVTQIEKRFAGWQNRKRLGSDTQEIQIDQSYAQMNGYALASNPKPIRDAIEQHRDALDKNVTQHMHHHWAFELRLSIQRTFGAI